MCGIAGLVSRHGSADPGVLASMEASLGHRGPDDHGVYTDGAFGLAHTRLSIIDLAGGHQPLTDEAGDLVLVANGEIYNHVELREELEARGRVFRTRSDCETILHAYAVHGEQFVEHLHGMFAFALLDRRRRRLWLARDRLGIKPLFIARLPAGIAYASEMKALRPLLGARPSLHAPGVAQYLQNQFTSGATTVLENVSRVLPGEIVRIDEDGAMQRRRYWSANALEPLEIGQDEAEARFDAVMDTVMRQHMRTDVPFGLFLSGGLDSAVMLAWLTRLGTEPVRTLALGFRGASVADELPNAQRLAQHHGSRHTLIEADRDAMFRRLPLAVWAADELMQDYANLPTLQLAEAAGRELKVVFTGEGGDEVFAGYARYRSSPIERLVRNWLNPGSGGFRTRGTYRGAWPRRLFAPGLLAEAAAARAPFIHAWRETSERYTTLQRMQYTDIVTALADNLLVKVDRMLMAFGVEGRVPLLDHRIVEFGLALPDRLKIEGHSGKAFLRRWAARHLPDEGLWRRKRGFHVPVGQWLGPDMLARLRRVLPDHPALAGWLNPAGVRELIDNQAARRRNARPIWTLLQFAVWHRVFVDGAAARPAADQDPLALLET